MGVAGVLCAARTAGNKRVAEKGQQDTFKRQKQRNENTVKCFNCQQVGHFAKKCPKAASH